MKVTHDSFMKPEHYLNGQVAIVTGGANGLGAACVTALVRRGAAAVIADIDAAGGTVLAESISAAGGEALFLETDATDCEQLASMVDQASARFGRLDILVNNVGGVRQRLFVDSFERSWRKHIDLNFLSMLAATHAAIKHMIPSGRGGSIVNVSSIEGSRGAPGFAVYAACKAGMLNFTQSLAAELADHKIRVNAIAPDIIRTKGVEGFLPDTPASNSARECYVPLRRMGKPEDVGEVVAFLCSPMASYLTGITIPIDGGTAAVAGFTRSSADGHWAVLHF
jgi:NAD(P)-dependent dehydrogenase (short-subunit alcohol dehydrogenase family)